MLPVVPARPVFVLESFYWPGRADITPALGKLISGQRVAMVAEAVHLDALER